MDRELLGKRIKSRRKELDMTQGDVARAIGVAISTIQRYEAASIETIKLPVVEAIARTINVNPEWLVGKSEIKGCSVRSVEPGNDTSPEAQKIAKAFDKATPKDKNTVRLVLSEYLDDDEQEYQYAAARGNSRVKIPVQDDDDDLPENDTVIPGL